MPATRRKPPPVKEPPAPESEDREPELEERVRTAKYKKMETSVQGFYIMLGGALSVLPNEVAGSQFKRIGKSFAMHSEEIADAWIDLAEDDARVRRIIESVTGFSTWGKVVGRHLEAIGDETPAVQGLRTSQQPTGPAQQSGDIQAAMALAQWMAEQAAQERTQSNGQEQSGPTPEQVAQMEQARAAMQKRQRGRPVRQQQQQPEQQQEHPMGAGRPTPIDQDQAPPMGQTRKPVGMPTPADLGVTIADSPEDFPAGGSQDVRG
jgi:hypothetical protein